MAAHTGTLTTNTSSNVTKNATATQSPLKRKAPAVQEGGGDENDCILRDKDQPQCLTSENRLSKLYKFISNDKMRTTTRGILKKTQTHSNNQQQQQQQQRRQQKRLSDNDPTYGFASRYSDSKSYFRTHNVDNTIPRAVQRDDMLQTDIPFEGNGNFRDVLFPLRASDGSNKSTCSLNAQANRAQQNASLSPTLNKNFTNIVISSPPQKKRVKFDDSLDALQDQPPPTFEFQRDETKRDDGAKSATLREKIYDFFANLF